MIVGTIRRLEGWAYLVREPDGQFSLVEMLPRGMGADGTAGAALPERPAPGEDASPTGAKPIGPTAP